MSGNFGPPDPRPFYEKHVRPRETAPQKLAAIRELAGEWRETAKHLTYDPNIDAVFVRCAEQVEDVLDREQP